MTQPLLIEIGVEELPAVPLLKIVDDIEKSWVKILEENRLLCEFEFSYTPRRLVLWHSEFLKKQPDSEEELFGPPVHIAFKDGEPTRAAESFAKKCGVSIDELGRGQKGGKEVLYYKKKIEGKDSEELLNEMVNAWIASMRFGKMMRWGSLKEEFIRPVRWVLALFGESVPSIELFGVKSSNTTRLHRQVSFDPIRVDSPKDYFDALKDGGVELFADKRREKILQGFESIEKDEGVSVGRDESLLDEVVAITEYPTPLIGRFDESFLKLPPEVIMTSMKEHQRYFPVFKDGTLHNSFVVVSNAKTDDFSQVIAGNERVLKPRLSDAMFFYENDLKNGLNPEGLKNIIFMDGLGSMYDKSVRESVITTKLAEVYADKLEKETSKDAKELKELASRAAMLAKADLLSEMVYEFTELQGIMGYYYAKALGEDDLVSLALRDQYLPSGEDSDLPANLFAALLAIAYKFDNLMALFSVGKIPTGSRDPFALRRAAAGIIRIVTHFDIAFNITKMVETFKNEYADFDLNELEKFFNERFYKALDANPSIITAVLASGERDVNEIVKKVNALKNIVESDEFKEIFTTFKRVANISKDIDLECDLKVDKTLFEKEEERDLFEAFQSITQKSYDNYEMKLDALFSLKPELDRFFDNVMVNAEDEKLRVNRRAIVGLIYKAFKDIADIKDIAFD
ncbi:glycine--tRNA ligase subunit beta [Hydrogenimonas thermophila]|uniref:Glycine--tRNA ligase beta subunit n=1 Tax=Hydrogenimonas thermophila TaxID=223786 RepID=A0A1I5PWW5_9BACT|nr:glycine--tRNA ligase subunit beta [Hydrogenimonas thermophila]WOE68808.1 glycine--tRNA ligase subunit beta [Hydrogenimonas thermophila]WOE71318.1 glycine--tRNA ligase subunit beta [Hydrogenimonas thermophila]SFP38330.1 glycyl-tRNA synthetase beta chain [Hydrogenimonas thermophila]